MRIIHSLRLVSFIVFAVINTLVYAQKTVMMTNEDAEFRTAIELFQKEKYGAAQKSFIKVIGSHKDLQSLVRIDAEFYRAICAIELFNKDGELFLRQFIEEHPENPKVKTAYFYLGKYNYYKKKYQQVLDWFAKVDVYELIEEDLAEFYFKRGYSYFQKGKTEEAKKDFYEIKDVDNKYAGSAKYYYAHIAYSEKKYETALQEFLKLQQNETFGSIVPYYIAQLYYLQGKYQDVIKYAPALIDSAATTRVPEISRIVGEAYYRTGKYKEAIPYLSKYEKETGTLSRIDKYQLGYAYYQGKEYDNAINYFIGVTNIEDSIAQNGLYHLADCYLKIRNSANAKNAFKEASKMSFDKAIQEDALYAYAKLSYEAAFNPYNEAIKSFQLYIKNYPNSTRLDEAYTYLVNVFTTSKNYKDAVESIEKIKTLTPELKHAYQKVAFYRGVDLYNNSEYAEAIIYFDKALSFKFDKQINTLGIYWKAEAYYQSKNYQKAIDNYLAFISEPGAINYKELGEANYNLGYAYNKLNDYNASTLWFRKFVTFKPQSDPKKINDALNRIGDGYFMTHDYSSAVDYYDQSYKMKLLNADYALFQKAMANGVQKKYDEKIKDLKQFIANYSTTTSTFLQKANYELAYTYLILDNQSDLALIGFKKFLEEYPKSTYENSILSKIGLIYYNKRQDENALEYFDKLIRRDRKSPDANTAIEIVKKIYAAKNNVDEMQAYLKSIEADIPQAAYDSISYNSGRNHYLEQDCKNAIADFDKYIQKFPDGLFILEATFYKAECEHKKGNIDEALKGYAFIISKNKNQFTETALFKAAEIVYNKKDIASALTYYSQLEINAELPKSNSVAKIGLMRGNYELKKYEEAIAYANKVLLLEKVSNEIMNEANFIIAKSYLAQQKYDEALAAFKITMSKAKNELGAEAYYNVAFIYYLKKEYKLSEKIIFELVAESDYSYWVTCSLILLADNYMAMNDHFQAKTTLSSVIENSDIPELKQIAQQKLDKIISDETAAKQAEKAQEPLKIEFDNKGQNSDKLFNEPAPTPKEGEIKNE